MPRQEFVKPCSRMIGDAAQHIGEPSLRIDTIEFRRGDQGVHHGGALAVPQHAVVNGQHIAL